MTTSERLRSYAATLWFFPGIASGLMRAAVNVDRMERTLDEITTDAQEQSDIDADRNATVAAAVASGSVVTLPGRWGACRKVV